MFRKIVLSAFAKAQTETPGNTKTQWADHLANSLWCEFNYQISRRTLLNYYNSYIEDVEAKELSPNARMIEKLCKYLGYPNYGAFILHQASMQSVKSNEHSQKFTYTLETDSYMEEVTILVRRKLLNPRNVA